jgi:Hydrazine synthase alpha subunit middle domain
MISQPPIRIDRPVRVHRYFAAVVAATAMVLSGCSSGGLSGATLGKTAQNDPVSPDFPVAYIKRKLPASPAAGATGTTLVDDVRVQRVWNGPADVYMRLSASPSATETNITGTLTQGRWDARDLDVSFDGKKLLFSLRPPIDPAGDPLVQPVWSLYEYDTTTKALRRIIASDIVAGEGHDVGGHYLADGRILFSSSRQRGSKAVLIDEGKSQFSAGLEGGPGFGANRNLPAFVLHVMDADGTNIHQIDFGQDHDVDPSVMPDGRIVYSRWDALNGSGMQLYRVAADGSGQELLYGRNSHFSGTPATSPVQFLQPRVRPDGKIVSIIRPFPTTPPAANVTTYAGITPDGNTEFGGDLVLIDPANYVEYFQPTAADPAGVGPGQTRLVVNDVFTAAGPSPGGRFASAYPLSDGTNRLLVSWTQCRLVIAGLFQPCTTSALGASKLATAPPLYGIWVYDPAKSTQQPIVTPTEGVMYTEILAMQPRVVPPDLSRDAVAGVDYDQSFGTRGVGVIDIKSVYDFDGKVELSPSGGAVSITTLRDPGQTTADQRPARFVRLEKAVGLPDENTLKKLPGSAFGASSVMREILGYAPVEPDGSVQIEVPANVAFMISVLDADGRRIGGTHRNWLQVRAGEVKTCNGCHTPGRDAAGATNPSHGRSGLYAALNPGAPTVGQPFPNTDPAVLGPAGAKKLGATMAEERARAGCTSTQLAPNLADCAYLRPSVDLLFTDVWTSPALGRSPDKPITLKYTDLVTPAPLSATSTNCTTAWTAQCRIVIHYPTHIAPLWAVIRQTKDAGGAVINDQTCTTCHSRKDAAGQPQLPAASLELTATPGANAAWLISFEDLLFPRQPLALNMSIISPLLVTVTDPITNQTTQVPAPKLPAPMVGGSARGSASFFALFSNAADPAHFQALSAAEMRLISEWLDIGAQYYNDPFAVPQ